LPPRGEAVRGHQRLRKHNNWSLSDNLGNNLLEPGSTPHDNLKFVLAYAAIIRAVDLHQDLLRASVATAGNDHRLGANEAPPAIVSIFVGSQLEEVIAALVEGRGPKGAGGASMSREMRLGVTTLPPLPRDQSDRNRTSPFAFTGNKFEFGPSGRASRSRTRTRS
jgi:glutamine synthetase